MERQNGTDHTPQESQRFVCADCNEPLVRKKTHFTYMGHPFDAEILCCPVCGVEMIEEELVKGRMTEVETMLEDK